MAKHNTEEDLWIVIHDNVYDVTKYQTEHPGGPIVLGQKAGRSATVSFDQAVHSQNAIGTVMPKYKIGIINKDSLMAEWQKEAQSSAPNILVTVVVMIIILGTIYLLASNWCFVICIFAILIHLAGPYFVRFRNWLNTLKLKTKGFWKKNKLLEKNKKMNY